MPKVYRQVNGWSEYIQRVCTELYIPGSCLTVDECMVRFTGRSVDTTTLPTKPIPTGYKVWVLAQDGYFLRWLWVSSPSCILSQDIVRLAPEKTRSGSALIAGIDRILIAS